MATSLYSGVKAFWGLRNHRYVLKSIVRFPIRKTNHKLDVRGGVGEEESAAVLRDFFRARRKNGPARKSEPV